MSAGPIQSLEELVCQVGEGWIYDSFSSRDEAHEHLRSLLGRVEATARERFGQESPRFGEQNIIEEYARAPHKVRAFIQSLGESHSPDMLLMVWRILQGMEIERIDLRYVLSDRFGLEVTLRSPYGDPVETYRSDSVDDAALLRHFGIMKMDGRPVLDGFYATK